MSEDKKYPRAGIILGAPGKWLVMLGPGGGDIRRYVQDPDTGHPWYTNNRDLAKTVARLMGADLGPLMTEVTLLEALEIVALKVKLRR